MRFRQVHLDFHTSELIEGIGSRFSKENFQQMLRLGHVDSITIFSKCHHGWAYHPSDANETHPHLRFDLLGAMIDAAHEIDIKTPVYLSAGLDEKLARKHPEWLLRNKDESTPWVGDFFHPGYHTFCLNSPYLDILIDQIKEVVSRYDVDGIFLDIVSVRECYCQNCVGDLIAAGKDPRDRTDVLQLSERVYALYTRRVREAIDSIRPGVKIFHNGGHIKHGRRDLAAMNSHIEMESLPTGQWGYDHFPLSVRYVQGLGMEYLGMTGKFHKAWGEFGGYKHPNALRYEASLAIANGAKCSIGDQLHPSGLMDEATYTLIGAAYSEVEEKEPWCDNVCSVADVALLTLESLGDPLMEEGELLSRKRSDIGAMRMLQEGKYLFDIVDMQSDFEKYKVVVLPDKVTIGSELKQKLDRFILGGGKVLASGISGLDTALGGFALDFGITYQGRNSLKPSYFRPQFELSSLQESAFVIYSEGQNIALSGATMLGSCENAYFNRDLFAFCSHAHTPCSNEYASAGMTINQNGAYIAWNIFEEYGIHGSLIAKEMFVCAMDALLKDRKTISIKLGAQGIVTLMHQPKNNRYINHILYAAPVSRGDSIGVIEDIVPIYNIPVAVRIGKTVGQVYLAPQMQPLEFSCEDGVVRYTVPKLECHQMVVMEYS